MTWLPISESEKKMGKVWVTKSVIHGPELRLKFQEVSKIFSPVTTCIIISRLIEFNRTVDLTVLVRGSQVLIRFGLGSTFIRIMFRLGFNILNVGWVRQKIILE